MAGRDLVSWYLEIETKFRSGQAIPHNDLADPNGDEVKDIGGGQTARLITGENRDRYVSVEQLVESRIDTSAGTSSKLLGQLGIGNRNR